MEIIVDNRELSSKTVRELTLLGCTVKPHQLDVGDYILSDRVCVERKTSSDFVGSVFNQRIFRQLADLKQHFKKPILIIEGGDIFSERDAHPNSLRGALASIAIDYSIPILWTSSPKETAALMFWIAKRENEETKGSLSIRGERAGETISQRQEYLVAGLPSINTKMSSRLLEKFGSPIKVFNASEEDLMDVEKIGPKVVEKMKEVLESPYNKDI